MEMELRKVYGIAGDGGITDYGWQGLVYLERMLVDSFNEIRKSIQQDGAKIDCQTLVDISQELELVKLHMNTVDDLLLDGEDPTSENYIGYMQVNQMYCDYVP